MWSKFSWLKYDLCTVKYTSSLWAEWIFTHFPLSKCLSQIDNTLPNNGWKNLRCSSGASYTNWYPLQCSCLETPMDGGAWWAAAHGVAEGRTWLNDFTFTFHFHALEKEMATHSSVLAWKIPGTGEPGGLPSMGSHRIGHDWSDLAAAAAATAAVFVYDFFLLSVSIWHNFPSS